MKKIAIYGGGGFGREVACLINKINEISPQWDLIGFFDDNIEKGEISEYGKFLGGIEEVNGFQEKLSIAIAVGNPKVMTSIVERIDNERIDFPNIISPDIIFLDKGSLKLGRGNIISFSGIISCNIIIGNFNIFNFNISLGHDVSIGDFNSFMPDVKISGNVKVGNNNFFGVGAVVLQKLRIGNSTVIGANSLITRKTKDNMTYIGNPAKVIHC